MSWGLEWLELPRDAEPREIKRAYALRLKQVRPDTDPAGFQQLHEAYQDALAWQAHWQQWGDADASQNSGADAVTGDPLHSAEERVAMPLQDLDVAVPAATAADVNLRQEMGQLDDGDGDGDGDGDVGNQTSVQWPDHAVPDWNTGAPAHAEPLASVLPLAAEEPDPFDGEHFALSVISASMELGPKALRHWLEQQPDLWSLTQKADAAAWLIHLIEQRQTPVNHGNFEVLLSFFGLDTIASGYDSLQLRQLHERCHLGWELQPGNVGQLVRRLRQDGLLENDDDLRAAILQLTRPFDRRQAFRFGIKPGRPGLMRRLLHQLDSGRVDTLPAPIDAAQAAFWVRACDPNRLTRPRIVFGMVHCLGLALIAMIPIMFLCLSIPEAHGMHPISAGFMYTGLAWLLLSATWLLGFPLRRYLAWQTGPEDAATPRPWLQRGWIPTLLLAGIASALFPPLAATGKAILLIALATAFLRYRNRCGISRELIGFKILGSIVIFVCLVPQIGFPFALALVAMLLWAMDFWRHWPYRRTADLP